MPFLDPRRTAQGPMLPILALPRADRLFAWGMARMTVEEMAEQVLGACFGDTTRVHAQRRAEAIEEIRLRYTVAHYPKAYLGTLRGLVSSFLRAYLPGAESQWRLAARIALPTLVVGGLNDRLVDPRVPAQVAKIIPDSRLLMLPGVGHVPQMEVPRLVARAIVGMLDEIRSPVGDHPAG
jgi:pimeloyl-ACP methyl ester carboxylesterase